MSSRLRRRRPSAAMLVALLALFVALGGPAQAERLLNGRHLRKGSVTSRAIRDHTVKVRDIAAHARRYLRRTPNGSITETKLANRSVGPGKLAPGAVTSGTIAPGGVVGANIADGSLTAADVARFSGRFSVVLGDTEIGPGTCWSGEPVGLAPEVAGADITGDVVLVTPGPTWPDKRLSLTVRQSAATADRPQGKSRFVLVACNPTKDQAVPASTRVSFNYVVIRVP